MGERLHIYRAFGTQAHVCMQRVVREHISVWYKWYGAVVLYWYQDRCWKFGTTIVSGMSSVVLSGLIQHLELVACLSAEASINRYSPPYWAAIHRWYPTHLTMLMIGSLCVLAAPILLYQAILPGTDMS